MIDRVKSRQRIVDHGEVFTPPGLVNDMLDLVASECERIDSRFLEPACGNGNFLVEVLRRKLATVSRQSASNPQRWERNAFLALCSIYGVDLLRDNIEEGRQRLLDLLRSTFQQQFGEPLPVAMENAAAFVVDRNLIQGDALSLKLSSGASIVFSEWSPVNGQLIKRRDFVYEHLLKHAHVANMPLFNDLGEDVFVPKPVNEFPPCHYLKVVDMERSHDRA